MCPAAMHPGYGFCTTTLHTAAVLLYCATVAATAAPSHGASTVPLRRDRPIPSAVISAKRSGADDAVFTPGSILLDTNGDRVEAHGGGMLLFNGTYYWVDQSRLNPPDWLSTGFNLYASPDLMSWESMGMVLVNTSVVGRPGFSPPWRLERPKLLHNPSTNLFTLWWHFDTASFGMTSVGVATSQSVGGPYTQMGAAWQPDGQRSYDMTVWADSEGGGAYLVRTIGGPLFKDKRTGVSALNDAWTNTTGQLLSVAPRSEAQCVFRDDAARAFYIWGSNLTGWPPNRAILASSGNFSMGEGGFGVSAHNA